MRTPLGGKMLKDPVGLSAAEPFGRTAGDPRTDADLRRGMGIERSRSLDKSFDLACRGAALEVWNMGTVFFLRVTGFGIAQSAADPKL